jgi:hypothetical protein
LTAAGTAVSIDLAFFDKEDLRRRAFESFINGNIPELKEEGWICDVSEEALVHPCC